MLTNVAFGVQIFALRCQRTKAQDKSEKLQRETAHCIGFNFITTWNNIFVLRLTKKDKFNNKCFSYKNLFSMYNIRFRWLLYRSQTMSSDFKLQLEFLYFNFGLATKVNEFNLLLAN